MTAKKKGRQVALETELADIGLALQDPRSPGNHQRLRDALLGASSIAAARVAASIGERRLDGFEEVLQQTFRRFLRDPVKSDPGCRAKLAALEALDQLESTDTATFVCAASYIQKEPAFGDPIDTAVGVRARAVAALARMSFTDLPLIAADLLADPEPPVRRSAADALAHYGERVGAGVVWLRLRVGDDDELVMLACASALLSLAPEWGLRALQPMLFGSDPKKRELSALALGEARTEDALEMLFDYLDRTVMPQERAVAIRALGLNRSDRARDFLLDRVTNGSTPEAKVAVAALGTRAYEPGLAEQVCKAAQGNARVDLRADVAAAFPGR
jgi:HEAT repeat protein